MRSPYTSFAAGVVFPLHERLKGHSTAARLAQLERSQWWTRERVEDDRLGRLRAFLSHAASKVPYYRRLFAECAFDPAALLTSSDLARLPLLTKALIRANVDDLRAEDAGPLQRYNTGGSSGEPLVFFMGKDRVSHDVAAKWRATRWWGVDIGDREIVVWGSPIELTRQDRLRALRDRLLRTRLLSAFEMSPANLDAIIAQICAARPRMLFGYPSALAHIARRARELGQRLDHLGIAVAFVTSERLFDHQREEIAAGFGCRVANGYGGRDAGFIAHECPHGGMHITAEDIIVEIVGADGQPVPAGESGEIVVTHLATGDFPFIRYRTGDVGSLDTAPCACGRSLPLLKDLQGRTTDFVVARDGTVMHGLALIYVLRDLPGIEAFKIVQESLDLTRVLVVPTDRLTEDLTRRIVDGCRARLGSEVSIRVEAVDEISRERSGKFRYVVSRLTQDAA